MFKSWFSLLLFFAIAAFKLPVRPEARKGAVAADTLQSSILFYVNKDRASKGLKPLLLNKDESDIAASHCRNMASGKMPFGHGGVEQRAKAIGNKLGNLQAFGENVAYGQESAREVVDKWLLSKQHRENIEGDFTMTGIGWARDPNGVLYFTEVFTK